MPLSPEPSNKQLLGFMKAFCRLYLNSGGPTSRLEDNLIRVGSQFGRETEVFATPTGVFVTLNDPLTADDPTTALTRVKTTGTNLGQLCELENLLDEVIARRVTVPEGTATLGGPNISRDRYTPIMTGLAALTAGFVASFTNYQRFSAAVVSGLITVTAWFSITFLLKRHTSNPIFSDFTGAFLTLVCAALAHALVAPISVEAYAIGGFVYLVPGLALTTAIAELADQNLVSGTAKFMQATIALLALGLAYLLFQQIALSLHLRDVLQPTANKHTTDIVSSLGVVLNIFCFGVIFKVPPRMLAWSTLTGLAGWVALHYVSKSGAAAAGPYLGAVMVGTVSLAFGKVFRVPSQVFSVPGIVAMLPGMLALSSFRYFASGDQDTGLEFTFQVAVTAVSIVFGLISARIPF
ncbi:MAG: threonine/serine ThrE exporter family protein [Bdellovibrionota bacterium]